MRTLWIMGEEQLSNDLINLIDWICKGHLKIKSPEFQKIDLESKLAFQITGIESPQYDRFVYVLISRAGNGFVDCLFFDSENLPDEDSKPIAAAEITKNSGTESGNMTSQRSLKKISIIEKWGSDIPFAYLISNKKPISKTLSSFSQSHMCDFATMVGIGSTEILISQTGTFGFTSLIPKFEYSSLDNIVKQESKKRKSAKNATPSRVYLKDSIAYIQVNLFKKNGNNDPGEGYAASRSYLIRKMNPDIEIRIISHNREQSFFQKEDNKLLNILKIVGSTIVMKDNSLISISKISNVYQKPYWKYSNSGEKLATIAMELEFTKQGWEVLFTNHAGCGKSNITFDGKSWSSKKGKGIPDIIFYNKQLNKLLVIEGEQSKNYSKGLKQCKDPKFDEFIVRDILEKKPECFEGVIIEKFLCTYGDYNNEPEVLFNLSQDMKITINPMATKV